MIEVPYGISSFEEIALGGYLYVDKTKFIEKLEKHSSPYKFFLRPRRFGKSLFTSMLGSYYDIKEKERFNILFDKTYIGENPTKNRNSFYILSFNFSGLKTDAEETLEESFNRKVVLALDRFILRYNLNLNYDKSSKNAALIFEDFLNKVESRLDKKIYVIIDEYDHFANELLSFKPTLFSNSISKAGFVRKWYEILKIGTERIIARIFATGVSPITLDSLTSGFNISDDITRHEEFNSMMGFTEVEVRKIMNSITENLNEIEFETLINFLKENYNGYLFSEEAEERIFNSDMILYYIKNYGIYKKPPKSLVDKNIASDYNKLSQLFEIENPKENIEVLKDILDGKEIYCEITEQFNLDIKFTKDDFKSLLFYLGMLTIDYSELGLIKLKIPNYVIKSLYFEYFLQVVNDSVNNNIEVSEIKKAISDIAINGDNKRFIKFIENNLFELSNRDFISFDEKYIKLIMLSYLYLSKMYLVKSEYEVSGGYIDIALLKQVNINPKYFAIIELKYISKSDYEKYGENKLKLLRDDALEQIKKYSQSKDLKEIRNLKKWIIIFSKDKCVYNEEVNI